MNDTTGGSRRGGWAPACPVAIMGQGAPAPAGAVERELSAATDALAPLEHQLWLLAVAAAALDVWLTHWGLHAGFAEGNPLVALLLAEVGIAALAAVKGAAFVVAAGFRQYRPLWGPWLPLGLALPWIGAVVVNVVVIVGP